MQCKLIFNITITAHISLVQVYLTYIIYVMEGRGLYIIYLKNDTKIKKNVKKDFKHLTLNHKKTVKKKWGAISLKNTF